MTQFRLHIDIPLGVDEEKAVDFVKNLMPLISSHVHGESNEVNYRLGHDEDRQKSNYLSKTAGGHVTNKKCRIVLTSDGD